jgi:hypothetical protein
MTNKLYPSDVADQAQIVLDKWKQINPLLTVGDLTLAMLKANLDKSLPIQSRITALKTELTDQQNQRDAVYSEIWDQIKRVRNGIKGIYGDNSSQYEMIGGIRKSERKRPVRKAATAPAPAKTE